ncbi:hypothetical protein ACFW1M_09590 [Streptomyces inhibens]|uniref:hypothetical protein n=1 Tax=Streptomyces inhibens TaxID=2293571 RepID=UPI0036B76F07
MSDCPDFQALGRRFESGHHSPLLTHTAGLPRRANLKNLYGTDAHDFSARLLDGICDDTWVHHGFTGTGLWNSPGKNRWAVLLTGKPYCTRDREP